MKKILTLLQVCDFFSFDIDLIREFADFGLYPTVELEGEKGIEERHLDKLKEIVSLHQALGINKEGIDVILELRTRVATLQEALENLDHENRKLRHLIGVADIEDLEMQGLVIEVFEA